MVDEGTLEEIRRRVPLSQVIGERVKLTRRGRSLTGLCPFHKEKTPSFHVNDERGFYHCFGCSASGDAIKFLRETEGLGFVEAVKWLAERAGVHIVETRSAEERQQAQAAQRQKNDLYEVGEAAASYFEKSLREHPLGRYASYELVRRGLDPDRGDAQVKQALTVFRVGYAPHSWDGLGEYLRRAGLSLLAAERVGLLVPRKTGAGYYDRFRHRLMFAVMDLRGRIVAFSGRSLPPPSDAELRHSGQAPANSEAAEVAKYMNSPESPIYRKREVLFGLYQARDSIREKDHCVVVEGNFDVFSLHARGISQVVAPLGTAFTVEQAAEIKRFSNHVTLLFDGDNAGRRATRAAREPCQKEALLTRVATLPQGRDPDDFVREQGTDGLLRCIKAARSLLEYLIESTLDEGFSGADAQGRAAKIREVTELIKSEEDPTVRALAEKHADAIAVRLGIADIRTFRALHAAVQQAVRRTPSTAPNPRRPEPPESARSRARIDDVEREILGTLLDLPLLLEEPEMVRILGEAEGDLAVAIALLHQSHDTSAADLIERLPLPFRSFAARRLAAPELTDPEEARATLRENLQKLARNVGKRRDRELLSELARAAASGDIKAEAALLEERVRLARARRGLG